MGDYRKGAFENNIIMEDMHILFYYQSDQGVLGTGCDGLTG